MSKPALDWKRIAAAHMKPLRMEILELFERPCWGKSLSATDVRNILGCTVQTATYNLRELASKGILEVASRETGGLRRGCTETFYKLAGGVAK
jgi:predicted ArsR family transcriptional regulator